MVLCENKLANKGINFCGKSQNLKNNIDIYVLLIKTSLPMKGKNKLGLPIKKRNLTAESIGYFNCSLNYCRHLYNPAWPGCKEMRSILR